MEEIAARKKAEEKNKHKSKQLLLLSKASIEINKVLDIEIILQQLVKIAIELTGSTSGTAGLYEDNKMVFTSYNNQGKIIPIDVKFEKGYGVPGWIIKTKEPYITNDAKNDKHVIQEIREELNFHQLIYVPILDKNEELLGCFEIHDTKDRRPYNENDIEILQGLSASTAVAIENAQVIIKRKQAEEKLHAREEELTAIFESTTDGILVVDKKGEIVHTNHPFAEMWNIQENLIRKGSDEELLNCVLEQLVEPQKFLAKVKKLYNSSEVSSDTILFKDGRVFERYSRPWILRNEIAGRVWVFRNITKHLQAENKIRESNQRLSSHLDNTPLGGIFWDVDFKVMDWNRSAEKIFGYSKSEALGKHANELIVPEELKDEIKDIFNHLLSQTGGERGTNENITKDGKRILCNWYNVTITNTSGKVTGVASLVDDVTIRKRNIDELKKSEAKFELLLESLPNAVFLTKLGGENAGEIIYANPAAEKQTGYKNSKLIGMNIINDFLVEQSTVELKDTRELDLNNNKTLSFFEKKRRADGTVYVTRVMITSLEYENEKVTLSVNTDITKQIEAQEKVIESEKKYKSLFDNNLTAVYTSTIDGKIIECNNALVEMFGYKTKEELLKIDTPSLYSSNTERKIFLQKLKEKGYLTNYEALGKKKDGTLIYTLMSVNLISENMMQGTIIDITKSKKDQAEILKLSRGIEQSPNMIIITDLDGNIEYANPKITEVTGYSQEELIGKNARIFISDLTPNEIFKELWDTINYGQTWNGDLLNKRKNGELYWENVIISPIIDNEGNIINFIGIKEDITEKRKIMEELIKAKENAEEASKIKSNFLANMSHELRTPMVGILGFTEILQKEIENPEFKEYASMIHESGNRLMETLNLILNLTKIEAEKINIELSRIDVIQNIKKTMSIFDKMADSKNIYLRFESAFDKFETETDARMFDQIISNLVNNSVKFTEKGGVTVILNKVNNNSYLEIKVKDTGIGVPKDKQELIWEEFRQVSEGISRVYEGTGLGLTVTNNFVNKLGGKIKLESELGIGSTFTVLLPIRENSVSIKTEEPIFDKTTNTPKTKDTQEELKTLLYVEDDKISRIIVKRFLKGLYEIDSALNGPEALEKAKMKKYNGILMDINLQLKMDGKQVAEKIKEMEGYKEVPIIAVTAYAMFGDREKYLEAGFTEYISKPFNKNDLIVLLNNSIKIDE